VTRNIGRARIYGMTASASMKPVDILRLSGALFANRTRFSPAAGFVPGEEGRLPNVAGLGARASAELGMSVMRGIDFDLALSVDYTGESFLGVDPALERSQGNFFEVNAALALRSKHWTASLEGGNLANVRGNRFAFGNPFTLQDGEQLTPLQPRRIRFSVRLNY